ncbi:hypothetical protein TNCV_4952301 [Trichonephila clavipes]|nr:hypothetical protein TNCV_4952301 [Trichonephila clavipes]
MSSLWGNPVMPPKLKRLGARTGYPAGELGIGGLASPGVPLPRAPPPPLLGPPITLSSTPHRCMPPAGLETSAYELPSPLSVVLYAYARPR